MLKSPRSGVTRGGGKFVHMNILTKVFEYLLVKNHIARQAVASVEASLGSVDSNLFKL